MKGGLVPRFIREHVSFFIALGIAIVLGLVAAAFLIEWSDEPIKTPQQQVTKKAPAAEQAKQIAASVTPAAEAKKDAKKEGVSLITKIFLTILILVVIMGIIALIISGRMSWAVAQWILGFILVAGGALWLFTRDWGSSSRVEKGRILPARKLAEYVRAGGIPADVALREICMCESHCQQFEANGKTPLKNKEGSSAFGKYQFLESHREPANKLGFDLNTEVGQDGYARHRFELYGTLDWEADPRSRACWEAALGSTVSRGYEVRIKAPARTDGPAWSEPRSVPQGFGVEWYSKVPFEVKNNRGVTAVYNHTAKRYDRIPPPSDWVIFSSLVEEDAEVILVFKPL